MKRVLEISKFEGESANIAKEDMPPYVVQKMENLRPSVKLGSAIARTPYTDKLTSGITTLQAMKEFTDSNGTSQLVVIDNNTIEESVNTAGTYGEIAAITNDERTAGSTVYGTNVYPILFHQELRSGAGLNADTDRPFWYGYLPAKNRYDDNVTIDAGKYLTNQCYNGCLQDFFTVSTNILTVFASSVEDIGLETKYFALYFSPVFDGQRGFPEKIDITLNAGTLQIYEQTNDRGALKPYILVPSTRTSHYPRLTAIDVFVINLGDVSMAVPNTFTIFGSPFTVYTSPINKGLVGADEETIPAYFLQRIDLNADGEPIMKLDATLAAGDAGTGTITVADYANWETCTDLSKLFIHDLTNDIYYSIFSQEHSDTSTVFKTNEAVVDSGSATIEIFSRWYEAAADTYCYAFLYDDYYKVLGSEMYSYLNIPTGDLGLDDKRYKYIAWNGSRTLIGGRLIGENMFTYFSISSTPDIICATNVIKHKGNVKGLTNVDTDFLVFTNLGVERVRIIGNAEAYQDEEYLNVILTSQKSLVKVDDNTIAFMSYQGPYLISNRQTTPLGNFGHLREWWLSNFTQSQMEACVAGYNFKEEEIWFSFPTYTTSPYTTGIIFVFDLKAYRNNYVSAWWRIKTDIAVVAFDMNTQFNLIGGTTTGTDKVVDFNTAGEDEDVQWKMKLKLVENPLVSKKARFDRLYVDVTSDDTIVGDCYFDGSGSSGLSLTFDSDETSFIRYIAKTMEAEIYNEAASTNTAEVKKILLTFKPLVK